MEKSIYLEIQHEMEERGRVKRGKRHRERIPRFERMEKLLLEEIIKKRDNHLAVSMKDIQSLAKELVKILYPG